MKKVIIVGGGFAGISAAKKLGNQPEIEVTLIDKRNHHLFQPLLYQVAMAGLSPAEIAAPIRSMLSGYKNIRVLKGHVSHVDLEKQSVQADFGTLDYDYLIMACGATHTYFGNTHWENFAPGLKTLEQATEIRRRVLEAFENAERTHNSSEQKKHLTFVIVGGGPTGVELAGAIGEMSRFTLAKDFKHIDPKLTRIILIEAGTRILPMFSEKQASQVTRELEKLGVQVWTSSRVTDVNHSGVDVGSERIEASTVLWAAGVKASELGNTLSAKQDSQGRLVVEKDLSIPKYPNVFVAGDQAHFSYTKDKKPLPGVSPVAMQQGRFIAKTIKNDLKGKPREQFSYTDKGQMATIGRSQAIVDLGKLKFKGMFAWITWLFVHIYYLTSFKNRLFVVLQWGWSYITFRRGARLIVNKTWKTFSEEDTNSP